MNNETKLVRLIEKGVSIPSPGSVVIADDVDMERISGKGVVINPGSVLRGPDLFLGENVIVGSEGPSVLEDVVASNNVSFASGFARKSVFLSGSSAGPNSHIREGCLLEELSSTAHSVGLKQTILFPFVTLGSLINFCDCLMSGGTSRKNHSEVGSSYIHFNYTPNQDKATPSIMGNVPEGVMLDRPPVFLGGQGGMVGPSRIAFGTVIAAGSICRKDILDEGRMVSDVLSRNVNVKRKPGFYGQIKRTVFNNIFYMANLMALASWYRNVRSIFISSPGYPPAVQAGALKTLEGSISERKKRFHEFCVKMPESIDAYCRSAGENASCGLIAQKKELYYARDEIVEIISDLSGKDFSCRYMDSFLEVLIKLKSDNYTDTLKTLDPETRLYGSSWLWTHVRSVCSPIFEKMPQLGLDANGIGEKNV